MIRIGDFARPYKSDFQPEGVQEYIDDYPQRFELRSGALLLAMTCQTRGGEILGVPMRVPDDGRLYLHNQRIGRVEVDDPDVLDDKFLEFLLQSYAFNRHLFASASGSAILHTSPDRIGTFEVTLPSIGEQRRIAAVLGALDDLIATNIRIASSAAHLAMELVATASVTASLEEVGRSTKVRSSMPGGIVDHFSLPAFDSGGLPERVDGALIKSGKQAITHAVVLVSRLNPRIPRVWLAVPDAVYPAVASTEFIILEPVGVAVEELWAACAARSFTDQLAARVTGTTGSHQRVDKKGLPSLLVSDPRSLPAAERAAIVAAVQEATACRRDAAQLRGIRDELLPLLLSGAVSPGEVDVGAA